MMQKAEGKELYVFADLSQRDELLSIRKQLGESFGDTKGINWQSDETWHVTICYCVSIDEGGASNAISKLEPIALPFNIRVTGFGVFENAGERALYLKVKRNAYLDAAQKRIYDSFEGYELSPFSNPEDYKPHITMAYLPDGVEVPSVDFMPFEMTVDRLVYSRGNYQETYSIEAKTMSEETQTKDEFIPFLLSQDEAEYTTASPSPDLQCANCRFYLQKIDGCHMVYDKPLPIVSGGSCKMHMPIPVMEMPEDDMGEASDLDMGEMAAKPKPAFLNGGEDEDKPVEDEEKPPKKKTILGQLESAAASIGNALKWLSPEQSVIEESGFKVLDDGRFIGWWTNNFKDKEAEIISEFAIDEFITKANTGLVPMPELWWMHIAGTKHGQVEKLFRVGHFALALGRFEAEETNPLVPFFKSWYAKQKNITMSHGFFYKPSLKTNGVYYHIRTYEISSLIAGREANPFTSFEVKAMAMVSEQQKTDLVREFGQDFAERIISQAESQGKALEEQNVAFKSLPSGLGAETMLLLGAVKTVEEDAHKASHEADEARKEAKDVGNRLDGLEQKMGNYADATIRLTEKVDALLSQLKLLTSVQAPASKSPLTQVASGDAEANFLQQKNEEQGKPFTPILTQMKSMGEFSSFNNTPQE